MIATLPLTLYFKYIHLEPVIFLPTFITACKQIGILCQRKAWSESEHPFLIVSFITFTAFCLTNMSFSDVMAQASQRVMEANQEGATPTM